MKPSLTYKRSLLTGCSPKDKKQPEKSLWESWFSKRRLLECSGFQGEMNTMVIFFRGDFIPTLKLELERFSV